tara:strand:+ start:215 stop:415 length:201 start_codon:yes stop_codon:yes gene_type:complete
MKRISVQYLEKNFDEVLKDARDGETYFIETPDGDIALVPDKTILKPCIDTGQAEDITHLWDHDDGA